MPEIVCHDVRRVFVTPSGTIEALHPLDASLAPGALNALVGPSGCGKSTLLRLLAGVDIPSGGSIDVGDRTITALGAHALREYRRAVVTYVAQRGPANLVSHLRLCDHFPHGDGGTMLEPFGLADRLDARPTQLSGGEQARAALAAALARRTPVLILDEPTAELDREIASHVLEELRKAAASGVTVVVATHDHDFVNGSDAVVELTTHWSEPHTSPQVAEQVQSAGLHARGITKHYGETLAVDDVSLDLEPGQVGVILGRSGSGKSTLLMILGGWLAADAGETGVPTNAWSSVGYVPQRFGLLPELSIAENIGLPSRVAGRWDRQRIGEVLTRLGLDELGDRTPAEVSIGQQQRSALGRAVVLRPQLLLADEPTSHQDARSAARSWDLIAAAAAEGTTCLVVTHDESAAAYADRVWELVDGRIASR
ncbi:MAG TPA: ATP-binding cassette domain-containing protein [Gaiellaceae bacterium]|nr:ATP-binding cassette domain-containing protein [Gaiellaceae bacterium]